MADHTIVIRRSDSAALAGVTAQLCGVDCEARFLAGARVDALEAQATHNLRHGFALVGVTEQFGSFVHAVHRLSPDLRGFAERHAHGRRLAEEAPKPDRAAGCDENACKAYWAVAEHQEEGLRRSQVIGQMHRLYEIALELAPRGVGARSGVAEG